MNCSSSQSIVFFLDNLRGGGAENVMVSLANSFSDKGLNIQIVLAKKEGELLDKVNPNIPIIDLKCKRILTSLPSLIKFLRRYKPKILLSTLDYVNVLAIIAVKLSLVRTKIYIRIANTISITFTQKKINVKLSKILAPLIYKFSDGIISVSEGVKTDLIARIPNLKNKNIKVIYNPVVRPEIFDKANNKVNFPWYHNKSIPVLISVGRLWKQKDYSTLIKAIHVLHKASYKVRLIILGEGPERYNLQKLITKFNLDEHIILAGYKKNPYKYLTKSDLFVLSSSYEGLPNVLIEALALNCKIVSTNCKSGPAEILDNGRYGKLVNVGDYKQMALEIKHALQKNRYEYPDSNWLNKFEYNNVVDQYIKFMNCE